MLRNDLHDINSIEHKLMQEQIRLDSVSEPFLYGGYQISYPLENHELYTFSQKFKMKNGLESIKAVVRYTSKLASNFDVPLKDMLFGGTEKEIHLPVDLPQSHPSGRPRDAQQRISPHEEDNERRRATQHAFP